MAPPNRSKPVSGPWFVKAPYCKGTVRYPDGKTGTIAVVKAGIPADAPWSILAFAEGNPDFPCDPTLDQLYDANRFEAYRELGEFCVDSAIANLGVRP